MSEHAVTAKIRERLESCFPERTTPLVVACSGGSDSVAVAIAVAQGGWRRSVIAHIDHGIQPEKDRENEIRTVDAVGVLAGLAVVHRVIPAGVVQDRARIEGRSVEEVARTERYRLLCDVARSHTSPAVITGHHQGDVAETVLLRLFSGRSALEPLLIEERRILDEAPGSIFLFRPALQLTRDALSELVRESRVRVHHDPGNHSSDYLRNRVRNVLIPALTEVFPDRPPERGILSLATELQQFRKDALAMVPADLVLEDSPERIVLSRSLYFSIPPAIGDLFLRDRVYRLTGETRLPWKPIRLFFRRLERMDPRSRQAPGKLELRDIRITAEKDRIVITPSLVPVLRRGYLLDVSRPGTVVLLLDSQKNETIRGVRFIEDSGSSLPFPGEIKLPLVVRSPLKRDSVPYRGRRRPLGEIGRLETLAVLEDQCGIVAVFHGSTAYCFRDGIDCDTDATKQTGRELPLRIACKEWKSYAEQ